MADLTGNNISQTFQKLIQIDTSVPITGNYIFNLNQALTTDDFTLLNGEGDRHLGIVIDQSDNDDGGIFIKNVDTIGIQNRSTELKFIKNNDQIAFLRYTGTLHITDDSSVPDDTNYMLYVKGGMLLNDDSKFIVSDGFTDTNIQRLRIDARNHFFTQNQPYEFLDQDNVMVDKSQDIFISGRYLDQGIEIIWQRSGSVVTCNGRIDHDIAPQNDSNSVPSNDPSYNTGYPLPCQSDQNTAQYYVFGSPDLAPGLIGNGTHTDKGEIIVIPASPGVEFQLRWLNSNQQENANLGTGVSYFSFSYRFVF